MQNSMKALWDVKALRTAFDKANEVGRLQADYADRTNQLLEKARTDGGLRPAEQTNCQSFR